MAKYLYDKRTKQEDADEETKMAIYWEILLNLTVGGVNYVLLVPDYTQYHYAIYQLGNNIDTVSNEIHAVFIN